MKKSEPPKIWDEWKKHLEDFDLPSNALRRKGGKALKPQKSQLKVTIRRSKTLSPVVVVETPGPPEATSHVPPASQKSQVLSLFRTAKQVEVEEFQRETASQIQLITDSPISQYDTQFIPSSLKIEEVSEAEDRRQEIFISPQKSPKSVIGYTSFTIGGSPILHRTSTIPTEKPEISNTDIPNYFFSPSPPPKKLCRSKSESFSRTASSLSETFSDCKSEYFGEYDCRLIRGGLAEMFLAAKKAEESEAALWRHRLASGTQSNADSIEIEVESAEMEYHLIKAVCTVTGSRERVLVYFTQNEMTAGIGAGEKIRLFQPNLQLPLSDASHYTVDSIIFCPEYIQRL